MTRNKTIVLLVLVLLLTGCWTAAWFYVRETVLEGVEQAIVRLRLEGVDVTCPDRTANGWPFRIEISCYSPTIELADGTRIEAAAAAATGHVTDPHLVVAALDAPLTIHRPDGTVTRAEFSELRSSLRFADNKLQRLSIAADSLDVATGPEGLVLARFSAGAGEAHLRPTEGRDDSFQLVVTIRGGSGTIGQTALLPVPASAGLDATLDQARLVDGTAGGLASWARAGGRLDVAEMAIEIGETRLTASGEGTLSEAGLANGAFEAIASRVDRLSAMAKAGTPLPPAVAGLASAFLLLGRPTTGEGNPRTIAVTVKDGAVTANGLPVTTLPRLF